MKTRNILRNIVASMTMILSACTSDMPEYVGTNVRMYQSSSQVNPKLESFDYTINFSLYNLSAAQDEEITEFGVKIKFGDKTETVIFLEDVKVSELDDDDAMYSYTFKDLKYNESYQYEYSYIYRSDLDAVDLESGVNSGYIYQDRFSTLITVAAGTPYDVGLTYATIPVQLNLLDDCIAGVGVEYSYDQNLNSKSSEYVENITDETINISIGCRRTDKPTYYRCYVVSSENASNKIYTRVYTLNFPPVDEHIAVDLGLSVKWAPFNVGSRNENEQKWYYYTDNFILSKRSSSICGRSEKDLAVMCWGNQWRTPNREQIEELIEKCIWEKVANETHAGYKVIGPNGNSIFIPSSGYYNYRIVDKESAIISSGDYKFMSDGYSSGYTGYIYGIRNGYLFSSDSFYSGETKLPIRAILPN